MLFRSATYSCELSGNKSVWKLVNSKAKSKTFEFTSACQLDPNSPAEWAKIEKFQSKLTCASYYKFVPYELSGTPKTTFNSVTGSLGIEKCKITQPSGQYYPWRGFADPNNNEMTNYFKNYASPSPNMTIQMIPISWSDLPYSGSPKSDYGIYMDFLKNYVENISDVSTNVKVNIPEKYIQMPKPLSEYKDIQIHGQPTPAKSIFWSDAISASDPYIDFSDVTVSIIFPTPNTPIDKFSSNPDGGGMSNEGRVAHILSLPPLNTAVLNSNSNFSTPNMMIHELTHAGLDMGDYESTGIWSHVGAGKFDYLGWDKFIAGFMSDQQVYCVDPNQTSTSLIFPSAAKGRSEEHTSELQSH